jgi:hypothetical protein
LCEESEWQRLNFTCWTYVKKGKTFFAGNVASHAGTIFAGRCFVGTAVAKENTAVATIAAGSALIARHFHVVAVVVVAMIGALGSIIEESNTMRGDNNHVEERRDNISRTTCFASE